MRLPSRLAESLDLVFVSYYSRLESFKLDISTGGAFVSKISGGVLWGEFALSKIIEKNFLKNTPIKINFIPLIFYLEKISQDPSQKKL